MKIKIRRKKNRPPILTPETIPFKADNPWELSPRDYHKLQFLQNFLVKRVVGKSCGAVGISRQTLYAWLDKDDKFRKAFEAVEESITEELEEAGFERAIKGSDDLTKFFLKARNRKKYGDKLEHGLEGAFTLRDFYAAESAGEAHVAEDAPLPD